MVEMEGKNYWLDGRGALVPEETVSELDKLRDGVVHEVFEGVGQLRLQMTASKLKIMDTLHSFLALSTEKHGVKLGGRRGNVTLHSFDGSLRIQIAVADKLAFDEQLQSAKALVDSCIRRWTSGARPELVALVSQAFEVDREGKIRVGEILKLRRLEINDAEWRRAMDAIADAILVVASKEYVRFYHRDDKGAYRSVSLDFAAL